MEQVSQYVAKAAALMVRFSINASVTNSTIGAPVAGTFDGPPMPDSWQPQGHAIIQDFTVDLVKSQQKTMKTHFHHFAFVPKISRRYASTAMGFFGGPTPPPPTSTTPRP